MAHKHIRILTALAAALILFSAKPALAEDYQINIKDDAATRTQELIFEEHGVCSGDSETYTIHVDNQTSSTHAIRLKNIDILEDSILLDKLAFAFNQSEDNLLFRKADMTAILNKELYQIAPNKSGSFELTMTVDDNLTNAYQGKSCTLGFNFDIINLNHKDPEPSASTPQTGGNLPTTNTAGQTTGRLPNTGEVLMFTSAGVLVLLGFFLLLGKRQKDKSEEGRQS